MFSVFHSYKQCCVNNAPQVRSLLERARMTSSVSPWVLEKWPPVIFTCLIHCAKLFAYWSAAYECRNSCRHHIIRGMIRTGNILYLSLITWVSLTSIKEMEHSPDEFKVGRWGCHSCLGCQVEGGYLDPSESNFFSVSKCAICSSMTVFERRHFNSFREQLSRTVTGSQVTCRSVNKLEGDSLLFPRMSRKWARRSVRIWNIIEPHCSPWRGQTSCLIFRWEAKAALSQRRGLWGTKQNVGEGGKNSQVVSVNPGEC